MPLVAGRTFSQALIVTPSALRRIRVCSSGARLSRFGRHSCITVRGCWEEALNFWTKLCYRTAESGRRPARARGTAAIADASYVLQLQLVLHGGTPCTRFRYHSSRSCAPFTLTIEEYCRTDKLYVSQASLAATLNLPASRVFTAQ